jgi:hypothetical protein
MAADKFTDADVMKLLKTHSSQIMRAECYGQAACEMLCIVAGKSGLDENKVLAALNRRSDALAQRRLENLENQDPALAAEIDWREIFPEDLGKSA